jgi:hypothetical protein
MVVFDVFGHRAGARDRDAKATHLRFLLAFLA